MRGARVNINTDNAVRHVDKPINRVGNSEVACECVAGFMNGGAWQKRKIGGRVFVYLFGKRRIKQK